MAAESATRHAELNDKLSAVITNHKEDIAKLTELVASSVTVVDALEARMAALEQGVTEKAGKPDSSTSELLCSVRRLEHANLHGERDPHQLFVFSTAMLALFNSYGEVAVLEQLRAWCKAAKHVRGAAAAMEYLHTSRRVFLCGKTS